jgi:hypothetical protein
MMEREEEVLRRWLDDEADGAGQAAEASFRAVFRSIRLGDPPGGFVARVMAEVGRSRARRIARAEAWCGWGLVAVAVVLSGLAAAVQGPAALLGAALTWLLRTIEAGASAAELVMTAFARGVSLWTWLGEVGHAVSLILLVPPVVVFLVANLLTAAAGVAVLQRLLGWQEESA